MSIVSGPAAILFHIHFFVDIQTTGKTKRDKSEQDKF